MTKEQWTELMNDTKLPWPVIIDDTLKQYFTDKVADEVFNQILDAAWDRHLSLGHFKGEDFSIAKAASEAIDEAGARTYVVLVEKKDGASMEACMQGESTRLKAMFAAGIVDFIRELSKESGEDPAECFLDFASTLITGCLAVLSKDKDKEEE